MTHAAHQRVLWNPDLYVLNDRNPPHFHAEFAEHEATCRIIGLETLMGDLPRQARTLVGEWALIHRSELLDWDKARRGEPLQEIEPLV
ncbi:MAG: DUF4160 domain-containing protein [Planctomycetota bacterium]|nr:DUF4160 domain-containing protein [Planctomycetota bacterium]